MCRAIWLPGVALLLGLTGCLSPQTRMQSAEESERDKDLEAVRTIGDVTEVANAGALQVSCVGLVTDLEGTGGSPRGEWRNMLEKEMRQRSSIVSYQFPMTLPLGSVTRTGRPWSSYV